MMTMTAGFFFRCSPRRAGRRGVRTEDMGNTKTGEMGNTIDWADALEKRVTDGRKTEVCEFGAERSLYGERAVQGVWDQPKERAQVA